MENVTKYGALFKRLDTDGDGKISVTELRQCVSAIGWEILEVDVAAAVEDFGSGGDGLLGLDDFAKFVEGERGEGLVKNLRAAFEMYTMDVHDCITPMSLQRTLYRLGERRTVKECELMIAAHDLDGDGVINFREFLVMMF